MKTILAPIDFSTATEAVVEAASRLALAVNGRVLLLHVVQPPIVTSDYGLAMENLQDVLMVSEKAAANRLSELKSKLRPGSAELAVEQVSGVPIHEILACAKRTQSD